MASKLQVPSKGCLGTGGWGSGGAKTEPVSAGKTGSSSMQGG